MAATYESRPRASRGPRSGTQWRPARLQSLRSLPAPKHSCAAFSCAHWPLSGPYAGAEDGQGVQDAGFCMCPRARQPGRGWEAGIREKQPTEEGRAIAAKNLRKFAVSPTAVLAPTEAIRQYYGEETAKYFDWMNFLNIWLMVPSVIAIFVFLAHSTFMEIETSPLGGLFSIMMSVWGTLYVCFWRRHCRGQGLLWDVD